MSRTRGHLWSRVPPIERGWNDVRRRIIERVEGILAESGVDEWWDHSTTRATLDYVSGRAKGRMARDARLRHHRGRRRSAAARTAARWARLTSRSFDAENFPVVT